MVTIIYIIFAELDEEKIRENTCYYLVRVSILHLKFKILFPCLDRLCGLVVRVSGYRYRGLGFDSRRYPIF